MHNSKKPEVFFSIHEQVCLTMLYEVLKSENPESYTFQMPQFVEKYQSVFKRWDDQKNFRTPLYNRISSKFDALKKEGLIMEKGQDGQCINYQIIVQNEYARTDETINLFESYIDKLQQQLSENELYDDETFGLIFTDEFIDKLLAYHENGLDEDYDRLIQYNEL